MAIAIDPNQTVEYVLRSDKALPEENQTVWMLGPLDARLRRWIKDGTIGYDVNTAGMDKPASIGISLARRNYLLAQFGIKGWKNLRSAGGEELSPEIIRHGLPVGQRMGLSHPCMDPIDPFIDELAGEIDRLNSLTGEQTKN